MMGTQDFAPFALSPFDHVFPPVLYAVTALYFKANHGSSNEDIVQDLECGIERLIRIVPFLSGEVIPAHIEGKSNVMGVQPVPPSSSSAAIPLIQVKYYPQYGLPLDATGGDDGARVVKEGSGSVECTGKEATPRLMPSFDRLTHSKGEPAPVFRAQINVLADGVALCLAVNHMVFDGKGNDVLFGILARCCHDPMGADWPAASAAAQVDARRYLDTLGRHDVSIPRTSSYSSSSFSQVESDGGKEEDAKMGGNYARGEGLVPEDSSEFYNFRFSAARIQALRGECNTRLPGLLQKLAAVDKMPRGKVPEFLSSTDVLTAVLWICATPAIASDSEQQPLATSTLGCAVDSRRKFPQALAQDFMGNTVAYGEAELRHSEICGLKTGDDDKIEDSTLELLTRIAYRIRCCITDVDGPSLSQITANYSRKTDWSQILLTRCEFIVSSLREWGLFGLDFGSRLGRVRGMEFLPPSSTTGECLVKPAAQRCRSKDGREESDKGAPWEVMVTLRADQVERMCQTQLIRWPLESISQIQYYRCM